MKSIVSVLIILNFVLSAHLSQESTPLKYLTKFASDQPTLQHQVVKHQTSAPTREDRAICEAKLKDASCTSGIEQGFVDAVLSCNIRSIQRELNACAKDENGQFCGSLWELHRIRLPYIFGNCSNVLSLNSCPSNCGSLLEDFRSALGCCINAHNNRTGLSSRSSSLQFDYRLWNLCNVSLPPAACGNGPTVNPPSSVRNCTYSSEEFFNKYYAENFCLPKRRQAYTDVLESSICKDSERAASDIKDACSVDTNGVPCGTLYYRSLEGLARLDSDCSTSNVSCSSNCRDGITAAKKRYGCCFRSLWFNTSSTAGSLSPSYLSLSVLQSCDIELPGACEGLIGSAVSTMKTNYITLIATALMCLQLMMTA